MKPTDIRVKDVSLSFEDFHYRTPIKFGGVAVDRVTMAEVTCAVETRSGQTARGSGSMPLGNVWSFPSRRLSYDQTLAAMKTLGERIAPGGGGPALQEVRGEEPDVGSDEVGGDLPLGGGVGPGRGRDGQGGGQDERDGNRHGV